MWRWGRQSLPILIAIIWSVDQKIFVTLGSKIVIIRRIEHWLNYIFALWCWEVLTGSLLDLLAKNEYDHIATLIESGTDDFFFSQMLILSLVAASHCLSFCMVTSEPSYAADSWTLGLRSSLTCSTERMVG